MMIKIRTCCLPQQALLVIGRGGRKVTTLVALFAHRQPGVAAPVFLGRLALIGVAHARLAYHGGHSLVAIRESFVEVTRMETEDVVDRADRE